MGDSRLLKVAKLSRICQEFCNLVGRGNVSLLRVASLPRLTGKIRFAGVQCSKVVTTRLRIVCMDE
jgi:hypothetical protein